MDTKSKKFKHTYFAKGLCFLLSILFFFGGAFYGVKLVLACALFGFEDYFAGNINSFTSIASFTDRILSDAGRLAMLASSDEAALTSILKDNETTVVDAAVNEYLDKKASIIKAELEYAVNNYDESYFNYEYTADAVTVPVTVATDEESTVSTTAAATEATTAIPVLPDDFADTDDDAIPKNIRIAQQILESATGRDFLNYDVLVRQDALDVNYRYTMNITEFSGAENQNFALNYTNPATLSYTTMETLILEATLNLTENQVRKEFLSQYQNYSDRATGLYQNEIYYRSDNLASLVNLKYYTVSRDGIVYTNMNSAPNAESIKSHSVYAYFDGKQTYTKGIDSLSAQKHLIETLASNNDSPIYMYLEEINRDGEFPDKDVYSVMRTGYNMLSDTSMSSIITSTVILLAVALLFLITFLCLCGHKNGVDAPVTAFIDKLPNDIHTLLSFGLIAGIVTLSILILYEIWRDIAYIFNDTFPQIFALVAALCFMILIEWLTSVVRIKKAHQSWFRHTVIGKIGIVFKNLILKLIATMAYRPKKLKFNIMFLSFGYVLGNLLIFLFAVIANESGLIPLFILIAIVYNAACLLGILKYIITLDKIIAASCKHENVQLDFNKTPKSLKLLAENLTNTNAELERAIEKAVKDEQTKTELITNVSHDLKTPLTSLITYSDILKKCNITDEQALKYIGVINTQSIKLKRLIEDLIEASKVSTGNVTLNKSVLNLSEIAAQAIVEFEPEMEKNGNEIRFSEPEIAPKIYADGSKTYRIITNLLSNAKKYSAPDTRVYIAIYNDDHHGYFEIKNISCEPLNISPDELTERFVRGDKSRTREGNGLGLSIAKDLCDLQGGELQIFIDGDLFKAIVQLPSRGSEPIENTDMVQPDIPNNTTPNANFVSAEPDEG